MMSMSPNILCMLAYLGMVVEVVSRGSLPQGLAARHLCAFFMLMAMSLPVQADHDFAVEFLDSNPPTRSRWQPEASSSALLKSSARPHLGTRVDEPREDADLCAIAGDVVAKGYQAKGYLAIIDHIQFHI